MFWKKFWGVFCLLAFIFLPLNYLEANSGKPRVAVIPFEDQSPRKNVLFEGDMNIISKNIENYIERTNKFQKVDRLQLEKAFTEIELEYGKDTKIFFDPSTVARIGKMLGAEYLVLGTVNGYRAKKEERYTAYLSVRMIKVETAEVFLTGWGEGKSKENMLEALMKAADDSINGKRGMLTMLRGGK